MTMMDDWRIWLGRLGLLSALICGIFKLIVGLSDAFTWKLGAQGWFTGGTVVSLFAVVMYLDAEAAKTVTPPGLWTDRPEEMAFSDLLSHHWDWMYPGLFSCLALS